MVGLIWLRGLSRRRRGRLLAVATGVAIAVALLASIGSFLAKSKATMTQRSVTQVPVDWQVEAQTGADPATVLASVRRHPGVRSTATVGFATIAGLRARSGATVQTTGSGQVLGIPTGYAAKFPGEIRLLAGTANGALIAQQTAANLHAAPGSTVTIARTGLAAVNVRIDGVVDLPQADSLFQKVGAPPGAQAQAPPDNVLLLPDVVWHRTFDRLAQRRPDLVRTQIHARLDHSLPADPASAFSAISGSARNLEARLTGTALVGDNLGAILDAARQDALYAQILFLFLGTPGVVLAGLLTGTIASGGEDRRRREQALLRARGATARQVMRLATIEAAAAGILGAAIGLLGAAAVGRWALGNAGFGTTNRSGLLWAVAAAMIGILIAIGAVAVPAWRDARTVSVSSARRDQTRRASPRWLRAGLDFILLAAGGVVYWLTSRNGYSLVLVPEGTPTISVSYWAFAGPALLWAGAGLLAWRLGDLVLRRGRSVGRRVVQPVAGHLAGTVTASMSRRRRPLARAVTLVALTAAFAGSTAVFNATYRQQAEVDARLSNGANVTVTESPGARVGPGLARRISRVPGVKAVEPLQHRFAYVGSDLQDLYGVRPATVVGATRLQDAYFAGGSAKELTGKLAAQPDSLLVSQETVKDFQLSPGDRVTLRLENGRTRQLRNVTFHYAGVAKEFPTAPRDSFLVANADYVTHSTGSDAVGSFLIDTAGGSPARVAARVRAVIGPSAKVSDIGSTRRVVGSSLTAVDLSGLTRVELAFALLLVAAATGLVLAVGFAERRTTFAIVAALGARRRDLGGLVWAEAAFVSIGGLLAGAAGGWVLSEMLVKVLTGVFDPPPAALAVPWRYLLAVTIVAIAAVVLTAAVTLRWARRSSVSTLREL